MYTMEVKRTKKKNQGGRNPKKEPSIHRYTVNMNDTERVRFEAMIRE